MTFDQLRSQHPRFHYQKCSWQITPDGLELNFVFLLEPDLAFHPRTVISGVTQEQLAKLDPQVIQNLVFQIGLVEMLSYWKLACSPEIVVTAGPLNADQLQWWQNLLNQGMGEFFYRNQLDFTVPGFVQIKAEATRTTPTPATTRPRPIDLQSVLIPVGGGKDSAVTAELLTTTLEGTPTKTAALLVNPTPAAREVTRVSGLTSVIEIKRQLDPRLLELNTQGYLNGHTPFSALLAFLSVLAAYLHDFRYVAVSNERSSNEGNVWYKNVQINHQYSKTFEFEQLFQTYIDTYALPPTVTLAHYFSFMRPLYELQIAQLFSRYPQYHSVFRSCNRGQKTNSWCGACPKCLFAYIALYPFLGAAQTQAILGQDLFQKPELLSWALELTGYAQTKPFECVGTHEENIAAFYLCCQAAQADSPTPTLPPLLAQVKTQVLDRESNLEARAQAVLNSWDARHTLPSTLEQSLKAALHQV